MTDTPAPGGPSPLDPIQRLSELIAERIDQFANRLVRFGDRTVYPLLNPQRQPHLYVLVEAEGADDLVVADLSALMTNSTPDSAAEFGRALRLAAELTAAAGLHPDVTEPVFGALRDRYHALELFTILPPSAEGNCVGARRAGSACTLISLLANEVRHFLPLYGSLAEFAVQVGRAISGEGASPAE